MFLFPKKASEFILELGFGLAKLVNLFLRNQILKLSAKNTNGKQFTKFCLWYVCGRRWDSNKSPGYLLCGLQFP